MKKEDRYQSNNSYWAENNAMLNEKSYQQALRRDKLTASDDMKQELYELTKKQKENEQAKITARQDAEREKEREERDLFEQWKRDNQKGQIEQDHAHVTRARNDSK